MPTYVALGNWTPKGLESIKDGPKRLEDSKRVYEKLGAKPIAFYILLGGPPDVVTIFEAADDRAAASVGLALAAKGTIRGSVHPALGQGDYKEIIAKI
jgi:uncharacterized protein with GYD domain